MFIAASQGERGEGRIGLKNETNIEGVTLLAGDVREVLRGLEAESVHCCISSPPYWGLRSYGTEPQVWGPSASLGESAEAGGRADCEHEWGKGRSGRTRDRQHVSEAPGARGGGLKASAKNHSTPGGDAFCRRCGAWRGELGQEPTPALFVEHIVEVFREVRRVLRPDGTLWLNLGDSYANDGKWGGETGGKQAYLPGADRRRNGREKRSTGLKPKDLCEIPSDVVRALRADGWWLRSRIPWLKRNAMPESTNDRPTQAVEYVFLLTPSARYFYDYEAGKMVGAEPERQRADRIGGANGHEVRHSPGGMMGGSRSRARRNSDWFFKSWQGLYADDDGNPLAFIVNPAAFKAAHFATFPPKLVEPMVKAGTSEKGCCPKCGKPWERVVEKERAMAEFRKGDPTYVHGTLDRGKTFTSAMPGYTTPSHTLGWRPGCECGGEPVPCTVLDPFSGAGTTCMVAALLGRRAIGIDLKDEYNRMAAARIGKALRPATFVDTESATGATLFADKGAEDA